MRSPRSLPTLLLLATAALPPRPAVAEIRRDPTGVNVNAQGATTVFISFGGLKNQVPVEATWCTTLVPAAPDLGQRCDPATLLGSLPLRFDQSSLAGGLFTDIMSIPPSVARRAYQEIEAGRATQFFYVRRFSSTVGGRDEYVVVTCRLTGGGARVPLSLLDVRLDFDSKEPVGAVQPGSVLPLARAQITYNGTGLLKGRWEIVQPGEEPPSSEDLLTEGTLPPSQRALQRRYTLLDRFSVYLPVGGRTTLPGPDPKRFPTVAAGLYQLLLRVEATDERESESDLAKVGEGQGVITTGAVAGFPLPVLRYYVGSVPSEVAPVGAAAVRLLFPAAGEVVPPGAPIVFSWDADPAAAYHRVEVTTAEGTLLVSALLQKGVESYRAPSFLRSKAGGQGVLWRVRELAADEREIGTSETRALGLVPPKPVGAP